MCTVLLSPGVNPVAVTLTEVFLNLTEVFLTLTEVFSVLFPQL
jgi:hypothetical protein